MKTNYLKTSLKMQSLVCIALLLISCTSTINPPKTRFTNYESKELIHLKVALNLTDQLRAAKWEQRAMLGGGIVMPVGSSLVQDIPLLARHTFTDVVIVNNGGNPPDPVDAVLTPKVPFVGRNPGATMFSKDTIVIKLEWTLATPTGKIIWADTITGEGKTASGWENTLKEALAQALRKSQHAMWYSGAIRQFAMSKYSDVKMVTDPTSTNSRP